MKRRKRDVRVLLDHTIVGGTALTNFTFREDRPYAGCRLCGEIFQPSFFRSATDIEFASPFKTLDLIDAHNQIKLWRDSHNKQHREREHLALAESGMAFTPEAAHKLAPFGLVAPIDAQDDEISSALREAPRAPTTDGQY